MRDVNANPGEGDWVGYRQNDYDPSYEVALQTVEVVTTVAKERAKARFLGFATGG